MALNWLRRGLTGDVDYQFQPVSTADVMQKAGSTEGREQANASREQQQQYGQWLQNAMAGKGPSVAQQQMVAGRDQAIRSGMAVANSARGANVAAAGRAGTMAGEQGMQQSAAQAAMLRAGEQQAYAQQYGGLLQNQRMQDLMSRGYSIEQAKAQLDYNARLQEAQSKQSIAETQANQGGAAGIVGLAGGALGAIGLASDATAKTDISPVGGSPLYDTHFAVSDVRAKSLEKENFSLREALKSAIASAGGAVRETAEVAAQPMMKQVYSQPLNAAEQHRLDVREKEAHPYRWITVNGRRYDTLNKMFIDTPSPEPASSDRDNKMDVDIVSSGMETKTDIAPAENSADAIRPGSARNTMIMQQPGMVPYNMDTMPNTASQQTPAQGAQGMNFGQKLLSTLGAGASGYAGGLSGDFSAMNQQLARMRGEQTTPEKPAQDNTQKMGKAGSILGGALGGALASSDVATKEETHPVSAAMESVPSYSFRYKPSFAAQANEKVGLTPNSEYGYRKQVGVMAQDLEKNPVTAPAVITGPDGFKKVDTGRLTMTNTAAVADLSRRLNELEKQATPSVTPERSALKKSLVTKQESQFRPVALALEPINKGEGPPVAMEKGLVKDPAGAVPALRSTTPPENLTSYDPYLPRYPWIPSEQKPDVNVDRPNLGTRQLFAPYPKFARLQKEKLHTPTSQEEMTDLERPMSPELSDLVEQRMGDAAANLRTATTPDEKRKQIREFAGALQIGSTVGTPDYRHVLDALRKRGAKTTEKDVKRALQQEYTL